MKPLQILFGLQILAATTHAQTYQFDGDLGVDGLQNGGGNWSTVDTVATNRRWLKDGAYTVWDNSGFAIAEFGNTTSTTGGAITVEGEIKLAGMNFNTLGSGLGSLTHSFTGGSLNFGSGAIINIANNASGGGLGGQWITFNSALKGENLTFQKSGGSTIGFARISSVNSDLKGTLTLKSATGATSGIYLSVGSPTYLPAITLIDVQNYSVFNPTGGGTYAMPLNIAGVGASNYGAIRADAVNTTFSGAITLTGNARLHTHINTFNTMVTGGIGESGGSWAFTRTAYTPVNTINALTTTYTSPSTYTGSTIFGRSLVLFTTTDNTGTEGGTNVLDFTAATAPVSDLLYNGKTAGALQLIGGMSTATVLRLQGDLGEDNTQNFASLSVQQSATAINLSSGVGGSMNLNLGPISRTGNGTLVISAPISGAVTGSVGTRMNGLIGTWSTYRSSDGKIASWAGLTGGVIGSFTGDLAFTDGSSVNTLPGYTAQSHLSLSSNSSEIVYFDGFLTNLASISMLDQTATRQLSLTGQTLRLAAEGGIQLTAGARTLELDSGTLTAGGADNTAGQLMLTNMSNNGSLKIDSTIANNGTGMISLNINGTGRTILTAANTFTGTTIIHSGSLEIQNGGALGGTTNGTKIIAGGSLNLSGNLTLAETLQVNGHGINFDGAIRNLSGDNTITSAVRMQSTTRFTSDSGTLILSGGLIAQISGTGYTFSGPGNFEVRGNITAPSGLLTKEGSGTLTLFGSSTASGTTTITNGALHLNFNNANAPATNMLNNGVTLSTSAGVLVLGGGTLQMTGLDAGTSSQSFGALTLNSGSSSISATSTASGSATINLTAITRNAGATLNFTLPASGAITTTSGSNNAILTGTGGVAYATVGLSDWAATTTAVSGLRSITPLSSLSGGYTPSSQTALSGNADIAATITGTTLSANTVISSLRVNQAQAATITLNATDRILSTGGILVTPNVGANATAITGGSIRAAQGSTDLVIFQNNTQAPLVISSRILNALNAGGTGTSTTNLTKAGAGELILEYNSAYVSGSDMSGGVRIQNGSLQLSKTVASSVTYYLYAGTIFTLGSGGNNGKLILGSSGNNNALTAYGGLRIEGSGTGNAVVSGTTALSTFLHYVSGTADFRNGMIGGSGPNENNLNLQISVGTLQLGPANTYTGKTSLLQNTIEVTTLANRGMPSSLGTGDYNTTTHIIDIATATTGDNGNLTVQPTLRYIGSTDSVTNRPLNVTNGDKQEDVSAVIANLENTGTGTVKFTSPFTAGGGNPVDRLLRLGGTNTGANEIVSYADATTAISKVEKVGTGTWIMTGASSYSGGTRVEGGTLLVTNTTGSGTGTGAVLVTSNGIFGGSGRVAPAVDRNIDINGGTLQIGTELPNYSATEASILTLHPSGLGSVNFSNAATLTFDLFTGAGLGDNTISSSAADLAVIWGTVNFSTDTVIKVSNPTGMTEWASQDQWWLFDWTNLSTPIGNTSVNYDLPTLPEGLGWDTSALFDTGILSIVVITVVPEPSRMLLLVIGGLLLITHRHRRMTATV